MATMTVNVSDKHLEEFRETVKEECGIGKGKLGKAIDEAICEWIYNKKQKMIADRQRKLMKKGLYRVGKVTWTREDLYDRSL